ncbi:IS30 family transposase [Nocardiopsis algeriensis]|uniref:IS30 family transposase n=1 Tax=Nocardiopsis algeriensis TaxID=1478215 RepID=A0A841J1N7_9ACTN|nr:IS30 family transposase [Nocardiopsis algeriensis]MBB6122241.1 IS30 family transposase [Nocardiopsis algeriensis]
METRRTLTLEDREEIALAHTRGEGVRSIARLLGRHPSVVSREIRRNTGKRGYRATTAHKRAKTRQSRPQQRRIDTDPVIRQRVLADLGRGRTPRQIAGRLKLEAENASVEPMEGSLPADGERISHEAIYTWIYALPKGELARLGVMLCSKQTGRRPRRRNGLSGARIVGMRSIRERPAEAEGRRIPGHWEGDLVLGKDGKSAAITLVDRQSRFTAIGALPEGKKADQVADVLIEHVSGLPELVRKSLTWDQGTEMGRHAALTVATDLPVFFADPHSPWQRPTNENTNRLIREYLPKGTEIPQHQPYLTAIAEELNNRPRACLGFYTPQEVFHGQLLEGQDEGVASTS